MPHVPRRTHKAGIAGYVRPFHDGRHSAITNDAAAGNSGLAVMKRAGHSDFRVTQQYLYLRRRRVRGGGETGGRSGVCSRDEEATKVRVMSPLAEPPGLVNMIRLAALKDINGSEQVQEWLDGQYPDPAVTALLADYAAETWGTLDQSWWTERFDPGDLSAEELTAESKYATGKSMYRKT